MYLPFVEPWTTPRRLTVGDRSAGLATDAPPEIRERKLRDSELETASAVAFGGLASSDHRAAIRKSVHISRAGADDAREKNGNALCPLKRPPSHPHSDRMPRDPDPP
jgi:hypothetical protein